MDPIIFNDEVKILQLLKNSRSIHLKKIHLDDYPYYAIIAIARDLQKRGLVTNIDGMLDITNEGIEYLNNILFSN